MFNRIRNWFSGWRKRRQIKRARRAWVKALRSGEYQQTKHVLNDGVGYCCLGVGCEVYQKLVGGLQIANHGSGNITYQGCGILPPNKVSDWLDILPKGDLTESACNKIGQNYGWALTDCNDGHGDCQQFTFNQIADLIESGGVRNA